MPLELFEKILRTFLPEVTTLILNKDGEPLLHPKFLSELDIISKNYSGKLDIYTNGTYLTEDKVDALGSLKNEVHLLITEHWNRRGNTKPSIEHTRANAIMAIEKAYPNIKIHLTMHHVEENFSEKEQEWKREMEERKKRYPNIINITVNTVINRWLGWNNMPGVVPFHSCPFLEENTVFFGVTGNMVPCCIDLNEEMILGNINTHSKEVLMINRNEVFSKLRQARHMELIPCNRCIT